LSNTCCNNNNGYTHWFKLNVGSCFRLLWSFGFMPIFSIAFVLLLSCSVVTPPNLVVVVGGVTVNDTSFPKKAKKLEVIKEIAH
jgi:hypothetical protein